MTSALDTLSPLARSLADLGDTAPLVIATLVECRLARGEVAEARALTDDIVPWQHRAGRLGGIANQTLGDVLAALGDADIAIPRYEAAGEAMGDKEDPEDVPWRSALALALVRTGQISRARTMAVHQVAAARAAGSPYGEALALRGLAVVADSTERIAVLRTAHGLLESLPAARLRAQVETDLAGLLILGADTDPDREERIAEATRLLVSVESFAFREQLWPLWGRAARLLERLGLKPGETEAADTLTQTQRRVAVLARRRHAQPRDRRPARGLGQGRRVAPLARLPQARHPFAHRSRDGPRVLSASTRTRAGPGSDVSSRYAGEPAPTRPCPPW